MEKLDKKAFKRYHFLTAEVLVESIYRNLINLLISIKTHILKDADGRIDCHLNHFPVNV